MSQWDKLFEEKIKEVLHSKHRDYVYASLSPTACGNVARALIAEEYYAQADRIAELEECINACYSVQKMQAEEVYKGNDRIAELEGQLDGCTCQGGHSEAWLKAKGRMK